MSERVSSAALFAVEDAGLRLVHPPRSCNCPFQDQLHVPARDQTKGPTGTYVETEVGRSLGCGSRGVNQGVLFMTGLDEAGCLSPQQPLSRTFVREDAAVTKKKRTNAIQGFFPAKEKRREKFAPHPPQSKHLARR